VLLQCLLDKEGATDLVVDLIIGNFSNRTFHETVELGIALLDGGNCAIQVRFLLQCMFVQMHLMFERIVKQCESLFYYSDTKFFYCK